MATRQHQLVRQMRHNLDKQVKSIEAIPNTEQRARAALEAADMLRLDYTKQLAAIRQEAVSSLYYDEGYKLKEIAEMLGVGVARAQQLTSGITPIVRKRWARQAKKTRA